MAYTPDASDATQPVGTVDASTAYAEFRALKAKLNLIQPSTTSDLVLTDIASTGEIGSMTASGVQLSTIVKRTVDLNDYAPTTISASDGAVTGTAFTSASTVFTNDSVGKYILIRGAGAAGISFKTTIAAYVSPHAVTLSAAVSTAVTGATFYYGADATAGVTAAYAIARASGTTVTGRGAFWLATQAATILLSGTSTRSDGGPTSGFMPYISGLTFLITATAVPPFNPGIGASFSASMFWPAQDGSATSPLVYPAAFGVPAGGLITNFTMSGATIVNAYRVLSVEPTAGGGRIFVSNCRIYAVDRVFDIRNGLADTIQTDNTCYFGPGVYGDVAPVGNAYLAKYTAANGEIFHLDPAATGSNYSNVDGVLINGGIVQQYRYAIRIISGLLDVSQVVGLDLDSTPTALSVEGAATAYLPWTGGSIYSSQNFSPAANNNVFNFNTSSSALCKLSVTGVMIAYAQGHIVYDASYALRSLVFTDNTVASWGQTTATASTYYVISSNVNTVVRAVVANNTLDSTTGTAGNAWAGLLFTNSAACSINGNVISFTSAAITLTGSAGAFTVMGNTTIATYGSKSLVTSLTGSATLIGSATTNNFDKP